MIPIPRTARAIPLTCRPVIRSCRNNTPSTTVNGADVWSTSDARPVGIPTCIARNRNVNWAIPKPHAYSRNQRTGTFGNRTNSSTGTAITPNRSAARKNGGKWSRL